METSTRHLHLLDVDLHLIRNPSSFAFRSPFWPRFWDAAQRKGYTKEKKAAPKASKAGKLLAPHVRSPLHGPRGPKDRKKQGRKRAESP